MLPEFLELALNAPETVSKIDSIKTGMSDSGVNLTQKTFQALEVPVPAVGEQAMIVAEVERELSKLEVLDQLLVRIARRSDRLRSAVLAKAFSGKLVPQDPADEPAPTLLERIAAARASQPKVARRRRRVPS
jgi:type I restriction enzyme S subunit